MLNKDAKVMGTNVVRKNRSWFIVGMIFAFLLAGCGGGGGGGSNNNTPTTGTVTGSVIFDAADKSGVKVVLNGSSLVTHTNESGNFTLSNVPVGDNQEIIAVKQGYYKVYRKVRVEGDKSTKANDIYLKNINEKTSETGSVKLTVSF